MTDSDNDFDFGDSEGGAWPAVIGAAAVTGGQLLSNWINQNYNGKEAEKQRVWSEAMLAQQNAFNETMWNKSNEYNSAQSQVERLRAAGLNPLYYGVDGNPAAPMQSAQPLSYQRASMPILPNPLATGVDSALKVAQISNVQADTVKKTKESLTEEARREQFLADIDKTKQELQNLLTQQGLDEARRKEIEKAISWADRMNIAIIGEKESNSKLNDSQRNRINQLLKGEKIIQSKTIEDFDFRWRKIDAEIDKMAEETKLMKEDLVNYALNHLNNGFMGTGISWQNFLRFVLEGIKNQESKDSSRSGIR